MKLLKKLQEPMDLDWKQLVLAWALFAACAFIALVLLAPALQAGSIKQGKKFYTVERKADVLGYKLVECWESIRIPVRDRYAQELHDRILLNGERAALRWVAQNLPGLNRFC